MEPLRFVGPLDPKDYENDALRVAKDYLLGIQRTLEEGGCAPVLPTEHRLWEYGMGLLASLEVPKLRTVLEVGGGDSLFLPSLVGWNKMLRTGTILYDAHETTHFGGQARQVLLVDPEVRYRALVGDLPVNKYDFVACISVIEHVKDEASFVQFLADRVTPGGILFLTSDYAEASEDIYHFRWMRERIYSREGWLRLLLAFRDQGLTPIEKPDLTWRGPQVFDYNFACMTLRREE